MIFRHSFCALRTENTWITQIMLTFAAQKKKMMNRFISALMLCVLIVSLGQSANNRGFKDFAIQQTSTQIIASQTEQAQFPFPEIPATLRTPETRKDFLLRNYWTCFDFANQALLKNRSVTEQGVVNFIDLLTDGHTSEELTEASLKALVDAMMPYTEAREAIGEIVKNYLYAPYSPMHNEELYAHYLRIITNHATTPEAERQRATYLLRLIERNRPGEQATDFTYYNRKGKGMTLAQTPVEGNRLILLFYDPECDECRLLLNRMKADVQLNEAIRTKQLSVLAIYTEGDKEMWKATLPTLPDHWQAGTDRNMIKEKSLYDLKTMPCLYLLDAQKRVLVKDGEYESMMD